MSMMSELSSQSSVNIIVRRLVTLYQAAEGERRQALAEAISVCTDGFDWDESDYYKDIMKKLKKGEL